MSRRLALLAAVLAVPAWSRTVEPASPAVDVEPAVENAAPMQALNGGVSLGEATQIALGFFPGRVVRAETVNRGGRREHQVRILGADGRVRNVRVDAQSGQVL